MGSILERILLNFLKIGNILMSKNASKLLNSILVLIVALILIVPVKFGLDALVWVGEAQLSFIRLDASGPGNPFNFFAKIGLWITDFISVWVIAFCQAAGPIFLSCWFFNKWNKSIFFALTCFAYAAPQAALAFWLIPYPTMSIVAGLSIFAYVFIFYFATKKTFFNDTAL